MKKRSFIAGIFAASMAPAIVKADGLMKIQVAKNWLPPIEEASLQTVDFTAASSIKDFKITKVAWYKASDSNQLEYEWFHADASDGIFDVNGVPVEPRLYTQITAAEILNGAANSNVV